MKANLKLGYFESVRVKMPMVVVDGGEALPGIVNYVNGSVVRVACGEEQYTFSKKTGRITTACAVELHLDDNEINQISLANPHAVADAVSEVQMKDTVAWNDPRATLTAIARTYFGKRWEPEVMNKRELRIVQFLMIHNYLAVTQTTWVQGPACVSVQE